MLRIMQFQYVGNCQGLKLLASTDHVPLTSSSAVSSCIGPQHDAVPAGRALHVNVPLTPSILPESNAGMPVNLILWQLRLMQQQQAYASLLPCCQGSLQSSTCRSRLEVLMVAYVQDRRV